MERYLVKVQTARAEPVDRMMFDTVIRAPTAPSHGVLEDSVLLRYYPGIVKAQAQLDVQPHRAQALF